MGIDVAWVDEDHKEKQLVSDPQQVLTRLANSRWPGLASSVCLRFVDPWGDAVFNQAQNKVLLTDLSTEPKKHQIQRYGLISRMSYILLSLPVMKYTPMSN